MKTLNQLSKKASELTLVLICVISFVSCIEEPEEIEPQFEKLVGNELESFGQVALELPNGDLVVTGAVEIPEYNIDLGKTTETKWVPSITVLDSDGNIKYRHLYPMDSLEWPTYEVTTKLFEGPFVRDLIQLDDEIFVAIITVRTEFIGAGHALPVLAFLDQEFNLLYLKTELWVDKDITRIRKFDQIQKLNDGNILALVWRDLLYGFGEGPSFGFVKIDPSGKELAYRRYPGTLVPRGHQWQSIHPILIESGDILIAGSKFDNTIEPPVDSLTLFQISPSDLSVVKSMIWGVGGEQHFGLSVLEVPEGYVLVKKYDQNLNSNSFVVEDRLGFDFFDKDLNYIREVRFDDIIVSSHKVSLKTQDGGIVTLLARVRDNGSEDCLVIKVDEEANELWRVAFDGDPSNYGMIESRDGSLIISYGKPFNGQKNKLIIKKIGPNGE